jgi:hypothetical protein
MVQGPAVNVTDVKPSSGTLILEDGQRQGQITLQVVPDDIPELTKEFTLVLVYVEGGATLNLQASRSVFRIRSVWQVLVQSQSSPAITAVASLDPINKKS